MSRIAVVDDYEEYAEMMAAPLRVAGHEVLIEVNEEGGLDFDRILGFEPQVVSVGLYRKEIAFDRPVEDFGRDVLGAAPVRAMEGYPAIQAVPIALVGSALQEHDVPTTLRYDLFLVMPRDIKLYVPRIEALAALKKRRKLSPYVCPLEACRGRLVHIGNGEIDLYCPRCGTGVTVEGDRIHYLEAGTTSTETASRNLIVPQGRP